LLLLLTFRSLLFSYLFQSFGMRAALRSFLLIDVAENASQIPNKLLRKCEPTLIGGAETTGDCSLCLKGID